MTFLPVILTGLFESEARDKYAELLEDYLDRNAHLTAIARHCHLVKKDAAGTVKKVLDRAIAVDEVIAVSECLIFAIEHHDAQELPLVDNIFVPAIKYVAHGIYRKARNSFTNYRSNTPIWCLKTCWY